MATDQQLLHLYGRYRSYRITYSSARSTTIQDSPGAPIGRNIAASVAVSPFDDCLFVYQLRDGFSFLK